MFNFRAWKNATRQWTKNGRYADVMGTKIRSSKVGSGHLYYERLKQKTKAEGQRKEWLDWLILRELEWKQRRLKSVDWY